MLASRISSAVFNMTHGNHLVYNTCWEDPRLDRVALGLGEGDRLLVITSAGCNALDYALDSPARVDTVDVNNRQNALLELKQAAIRQLDYDVFFSMFGRGVLSDWKTIYPEKLRPDLSPASQQFWDKNGKFFYGKGRRDSFYFRGTAGLFAWSMNVYINRFAKIRTPIDKLLEAQTVEEQAEIYYRDVKPAFWGPTVKWSLRRDAILGMLGVPRAQRRQLEKYYPGGIVKFIEDRLDEVFAKLPIKDNYFWRVYLTGEYTPECCPNYLKPEHFAALKAGLVDTVHSHTSTILDYLQSTRRGYSHYVLLDHMDWLAEHHAEILQQQWQAIVDHADPGAMILWRSAALEVEFVDPIEVTVAGKTHKLGDLLHYQTDLAAELHAKDRVNTYGSFYIARLNKPSDNNHADEPDERTGAIEDSVPSGAFAHSR
jgi:S-adenosylmethionine-diacylglycerol 3-amino-3-carboxypropyl transferase